jgi:hypothetical protein
MSKKKDEEIALFKYGIIARVLNERGLKHTLFRQKNL